MIVTQGYGTDQMIVTQGYGGASAPSQMREVLRLTSEIHTTIRNLNSAIQTTLNTTSNINTLMALQSTIDLEAA